MGGTTAKAALVDAGQFLRVNSLEVGGGINIAGPAAERRRLSRARAGDRHRRGRRGRRQHRAPRCGRRAARRPRQRRRRARARVLRPRRHDAHGHRRQRDPRAHQSARARRRRPARSGRELAEARAAGRSRGAAAASRCEDAAWGVHRVANATMARALRAVSTERGRDPRDLAMLAFGGNGPVHAATLARLLDITRILVPPVPGLFSALGMLFPEMEHHYVRTFKQRLDRARCRRARARRFARSKPKAARRSRGEGFAATAASLRAPASTCATPAPTPS